MAKTNKTAPAAVTLEQVKAILAEVREKIDGGIDGRSATNVMRTYGGLTKNTHTLEDVAVKKYHRIINKCTKLLDDKVKHDDAMRKAAAEREKRAAENAEKIADLVHEGEECRKIADLIRSYDAKIDEAVAVQVKQADNHRISLAQRLAAIKPKCKALGMSFADFKDKYVGDVMGRTQLYQLLKIGRGELTLDKIRLLESEKKRDQRAGAKASGTGASRTEPTPPTSPPEVYTAEDGTTGTRQRLLNVGYTEAIDGVTGKPVFSKSEPVVEAPPTQPANTTIEVPPKYEETPEEKSDRLLAEWKKYTAETFNGGMQEDERKKARVWFNSQRWDVVPLTRDGRKAA